MDNGEIESADEEMPSHGGRQYRPVVSHEQSIVQMTSMESGPPTEMPKQKIRIPSQSENVPNPMEGPSNGHDELNNSQRESKLELFGFDSLVNKLGLKSMTGEQIPTPSSPRDGEDISITIGSPKVLWDLYEVATRLTLCGCICYKVAS